MALGETDTADNTFDLTIGEPEFSMETYLDYSNGEQFAGVVVTNNGILSSDAVLTIYRDGNHTKLLYQTTLSGIAGGESNGKWQISNRIDMSEGIGASVDIETWKPTTPDEKKRYACMGQEPIQYTLAKGNAYRLIIENAMQGPLCFDSFEAVLGDYTIGRTYNIYPCPDKVYSMGEEVQFTIKIPEAIYKSDRTYKMICVTQNGFPIIYDDLDKDPETITVRTNKFYAYALIYK